MLSLLAMYSPTIAAATLFAIALNLMGQHLALQERSVSVLCLSQGAAVGVLLGIGLNKTFDSIFTSILPFLTAFVAISLTYGLQHKIVSRRRGSASTQLLNIFLVLLAMASFISSVFPQLESHLAQSFFGDLATLSTRASYVMIGLALLVILILKVFQKTLFRYSIDFGIFGFGLNSKPVFLYFNILMLLTLAYSIQSVGLLFTLTGLFVPTSILALSGLKGLRGQLFYTSFTVALGTLGGFFLSLSFSWIPTAPAITLTTACLCLILCLGIKADGLLPRL